MEKKSSLVKNYKMSTIFTVITINISNKYVRPKKTKIIHYLLSDIHFFLFYISNSLSPDTLISSSSLTISSDRVSFSSLHEPLKAPN